eukprot:ANDGO_00241.mRNA.1 hypothetical protein
MKEVNSTYCAVFYGLVFLSFMIAIVIEHRSKSVATLRLNPWRVLGTLVGCYILFYAVYFFLVYTYAIIANVPFFVSKFYSMDEFDDKVPDDPSPRLIVNVCALTLSLGLTSIFLSLFVERSSDSWDYVGSIGILHVCYVTILNGQFPIDEPFWLALAGGIILCFILSFCVLIWLERLDWKSSMGQKKRSSSSHIKHVDGNRNGKRKKQSMPVEDDDPFAALAARIEPTTALPLSAAAASCVNLSSDPVAVTAVQEVQVASTAVEDVEMTIHVESSTTDGNAGHSDPEMEVAEIPQTSDSFVDMSVLEEGTEESCEISVAESNSSAHSRTSVEIIADTRDAQQTST